MQRDAYRATWLMRPLAELAATVKKHQSVGRVPCQIGVTWLTHDLDDLRNVHAGFDLCAIVFRPITSSQSKDDA